MIKYEYKVYCKDTVYCVSTLAKAIDMARNESLAGGLASVIKDNVKLVAYYNGDLKEWNIK